MADYSIDYGDYIWYLVIACKPQRDSLTTVSVFFHLCNRSNLVHFIGDRAAATDNNNDYKNDTCNFGRYGARRRDAGDWLVHGV